MKTQFKNKKAFTLIELLIVIAIIGILFIVLVSKVDFATDKAKASGVQTDFRSFQTAFEQVARENSGYATLGWDTGDDNGDRIRNSYDKGDNGSGGGIAQNGIQDGTEVFVGSKTYGEDWTGTYTLVNPDNSKDASAFVALENAINANLDPKLHITITPNADASGNLTGSAAITMANQAHDPWKNEYAGAYITNATVDSLDRGSIIMYSTGANGKLGVDYSVSGGLVGVEVPGNNINGKDDYVLSVTYSYANGYGEVQTGTAGFSSNQSTLTSTPIVDNGVNAGGMSAGTGSVPGGNGGQTPSEPSETPSISASEGLEYSLKQDGTYELVSKGNCTDNTIVIAAEIDGIPVTSIANGVFSGCSYITSIQIPNSVTYIGGYALAMCGFTSIELPDSLTRIECCALADCPNLESITFPSSVTYIGECLLSGSSNIQSINFEGTVVQWGNMSYYNINDWYYGVQATYIQCSDGKVGFDGVLIPDTLFYSEGLEYTLKQDGTYEVYSMGACTDTDVVIPAKVDGIAVTSIGQSAFDAYGYAERANITSIVIPDSVTSIGDYAFYNCTGLTSITIPNSVTSIGIAAFFNCANLNNVVIPESVTYISEGLFVSCSSLTNLSYTGTTAQWQAIGKYPSWCGADWIENSEVAARYVQCLDGQVDIIFYDY